MGLATQVSANIRKVMEQEGDKKGEEKVKCTGKDCDWKGDRDDLKDGACPKCGSKVEKVGD